jgi:hypothetical protein
MLHPNNNSQDSRLQRRGHRGEQKWQQQRTLSKISQFSFSQQQTKPNQTQKKTQVPNSKNACKKWDTHHTHTLTSVFLGQLFLVLFLFLLTKEIGKIVELFFFGFSTVKLTNFSPFFFSFGNFCQILRYHKIERKKKNPHWHKDLIHDFFVLWMAW